MEKKVDIATINVKVEVEDCEYITPVEHEFIQVEIKKEDPLEIEDYGDVQCYSDNESENTSSEDTSIQNESKSQDTKSEERPYICKECDKSFTKIHYLIKHNKFRHSYAVKTPYNCKECGENFFRKSLFEKHLKSHTTDFKCHLCNKFNDSTTSLLKHQFTDHWDKFMCSFCTITYFTMPDLEDHLRDEHRDRSKEILDNSKCHVCKIDVTRLSELWAHIERNHRMICGECLDDFPRRTDLIEHLFEQHHPEYLESDETHQTKGLPSFFGRCNRCEYTSSSRLLLMKHFERNHKGFQLDIEIKCRHCEEFFKTVEEVSKHFTLAHQASFLKTVYGRCNMCNHSSSTRGSLIRHFEAKHAEFELNVEIKCKECDEFFKSQYEIKQHSKVAHANSVRPRNVFGRCHLCKQLSATKQSLERHFGNLHPGEAYNFEYKCKECENFFLSIVDLDEHTKAVHSSDSDSKANRIQVTMKTEFDSGGESSSGSLAKPAYKQKSANAKCSECLQLFHTTYSLNRHFERLHKGCELFVEYKCDYCEEYFKTTEEVRGHTKMVHVDSEEKPTIAVFGKCNVCKYISNSKQCLMRHFERRHPGLKYDFAFKCKHCDEFFKSNFEVKRHSKIVHPVVQTMERPSICFGRCSICKKFSTSKCNYLKHMKTMHPQCEINIDFKCQYCEEFFKNDDRLNQHIQVTHECSGSDDNEDSVIIKQEPVVESDFFEISEVKTEIE